MGTDRVGKAYVFRSLNHKKWMTFRETFLTKSQYLFCQLTETKLVVEHIEDAWDTKKRVDLNWELIDWEDFRKIHQHF